MGDDRAPNIAGRDVEFEAADDDVLDEPTNPRMRELRARTLRDRGRERRRKARPPPERADSEDRPEPGVDDEPGSDGGDRG